MSGNSYSAVEWLTAGTHFQNIVLIVTLLTHLRRTFYLHLNRQRACPSGRVVKPPAAVHAGQGSLPVRVEALVHPLRESSL